MSKIWVNPPLSSHFGLVKGLVKWFTGAIGWLANEEYENMKSKLSVEFKNTPGDTSLVPCSVSGCLTRDQSLSDVYIVLADNLGEENQLRKGDWTWVYQSMCWTSEVYLWCPQKARKSLRKEFPHIYRQLWGNAVWSPSYFLAKTGQVTLEIIKKYVENQGKPWF